MSTKGHGLLNLLVLKLPYLLQQTNIVNPQYIMRHSAFRVNNYNFSYIQETKWTRRYFQIKE